MTDRHDLADRFLSGTRWAQAQRRSLAGDASNRRYERLTDPATGQTAVLMDAPPEKGEDVRPFIRIARYLRALGMSAPDLLAEDPEAGFLLLEDLGDDLFARVVINHPGLEPGLYAAATDLLADLHHAQTPDVPLYDTGLMTDLAALAFSKYHAGLTGEPTADLERQFADLFRPILDAHAPETPVLILRDYHAENLLWLPDRQGVARVGLLDFQDAMLGHPAYDLVSLLQDARRDVPKEVETEMVARYCTVMGCNAEAFAAGYAVMGAQRNLRILGVFARLGMDLGKPHYVDLIPRVWNLLQRDLAHPALAPLADFLRDTLPAPDPARLNRLRAA